MEQIARHPTCADSGVKVADVTNQRHVVFFHVGCPRRRSAGSRSFLARDALVWADLGGGWPEGPSATVSMALQQTPVDANADLLLAVCASLNIYAERWDRLVEMQARIMAWQ